MKIRPYSSLLRRLSGWLKQLVQRDKLIVCTCVTGRNASNEFIILRHLLGYPRVVVDEGSWTVWGSKPGNPVVKDRTLISVMGSEARASFDTCLAMEEVQDYFYAHMLSIW